VTNSDGGEVARSVKLSLKQRREKVRQKIAAAQAKMMEDDELPSWSQASPSLQR
jgi:hypothetical protein